MHNDQIHLPDILRIAIAHYQFETIHPFLDGNGRMGRLLITLLLLDRKILQKPLLYISSFFERDRYLYYIRLHRVRTDGDMYGWIKYFLVGVVETAEQALDKLHSILNVKREVESLVNYQFGKRTAKGMCKLNALYENPYIKIDKVVDITGLSFKAASDLVALFVDQNILFIDHYILYEITGQSRNRIFVFKRYLLKFLKN
ncbi:hypothetical protein JCM31826_01110 [Thermaurantimonas aggregans]|uniref:Fido domain-containing protein n=1 Tax=Thermaurantimonas aggregans TaxID=2173829 RepID=A0A401XHY8_9FLAO|nr:hypothetical protein JCM31826_01110 [Thermaurantimonas aggregans]